MRIDLTRIDEEPQTFQEDLELAPEDLDLPQIPDSLKVRLSGEVRASADRFKVAGSIAAACELACSRCLEPAQWQVGEEFSVELRWPKELGPEKELDLAEDDLEVWFLKDNYLDLAELAAQQLQLAVPMKILCNDNCAGLCPVCGGNRNQKDACNCEPEPDPRWQALRGLEGTN